MSAAPLASRIIDCTQGDSDWFTARCGCVTASRVADVMAKLRSGEEAVARANYKMELVCELLTGNAADHYTSPSMKWGTEQEPFARAAYELKHGMVDQIGFVYHPTITRAGASPDGLVGDSGLIEIKCPNTATHIGYIMAGEVPSEYQLQMLWQMDCAERDWCDFVSYDPRLPEHLQLFVKRFPRDEERLQVIRLAVETFNHEVDEIIRQLREVNR